MTIKTKVIIYSAKDVITSNIEDLYNVAIDNDDMEDFNDWLKYECNRDMADLFEQMEDYVRMGKSIEDLIEFYKNEYKDYQADKMEYLLDCDRDYHSREIEVSVDVAVN